MQEIIEAMILKSLCDGASEEEAKAYLQGMSDCLLIIEASVEQSEMEMQEDETDPLYVHTWNDVIDEFSSKILKEFRKRVDSTKKTMINVEEE